MRSRTKVPPAGSRVMPTELRPARNYPAALASLAVRIGYPELVPVIEGAAPLVDPVKLINESQSKTIADRIFRYVVGGSVMPGYEITGHEVCARLSAMDPIARSGFVKRLAQYINEA